MTDSPPRPAVIDTLPDGNRSAFCFPLPEKRLTFTGERYVSGLDGPIRHEHYHRYLFATRFCRDKDVLDVASGEGYGTALLGQVARSVVGVDIDAPSVDFANRTYLSSNTSFRCGDAAALPIATASVDVVVSFETIEHLGDQTRFIAEVARVLRPGGLLIISSPNKPVYNQHNEVPNPFHLNELDRDAFLGVLRVEFPNILLCGQRAVDGSVILSQDAPTDRHETFEAQDGLLYTRQAGIGAPHYFIALASTSPLPRPRNSLLHNPAHFAGLRAALDRLDQARADAEQRLAAIAQDRDRLAEANQQAQARMVALDAELAASKDTAESSRHALGQAETRMTTLLRDLEQRELSAIADRNAMLAGLHTRIADLEQRELSAIADRNAMLAVLRTRIADLDQQLHRRGEELAAAREHLSRVYHSTSWRISRPVRLLGMLRGRRPQALLRQAARLAYWTVTLQLAARLREWRMVRLIYATGSFDHDYYVSRYADVASSGLEPALHYIRIGAAEGRDPSPRFVTEVYRSRHPDLPLSQNPLVDAIRNGRVEDGHLQVPPPMPPRAASLAPVDPLAGIRSLTFRTPAAPAVTVIVDARATPAIFEQNLRAIAACQDEWALDLVMLVESEAALEIAGIGRIVAGADDAFQHFDAVASQSQAHHIALLDAGTEIDAKALAAGLATAADSADVGAFCAARTGADGTLVDAGLQLDPDGSLQPRGRGLAPDHYRVASVSEVDVVAPGLVIVSRQAWQSAGGFGRAYQDPRYAAADFSLRAHAAGYRILCQPFMRARMPHAPQRLPAPAADCERLLRERTDAIEQMKHNRKPRVLFVDHFIPTPDRDAGSEFLCWTMRIFVGLGYQVAFLPVMTHDVAESYTDDLRRLGIEVISGPAVPAADTFIHENAAIYQLIILYRAPIAYRHIDDIRRVAPYTRVVFNTVDLHFLREERQAALVGSAEAMDRAQETRRIELASIRKADCTIILSEAEREILSGLVGAAALQFVPLISQVPGSEAAFEARQDIVFVGGFSHLPNVDAVQYFTSTIWPLVHAQLPEARFIIVGSNAPDAVRDLADPALGIEMRGFVADLRALLATCRLTVAPLRYGAGMKGKVVTSLAHGVPCIATPIAVEGSGLAPGEDILVGSEAAGFAAAVIAAYQDRALWERLSVSGTRFAEANFSVARVTELLREMLRSLNLPA